MAKGDRVYVYRNWGQLEGIYQHHGIDCGDGTVIHYRKPSEKIEKTSMKTFSQGNPVYVVEYGEGFGYIADAVVEKAESRLGEQEYNLLFNNCEHFASWCKTGVSESSQVKNFLPLVRKLETSKLYEPIKNALKGKDNRTAQQLLSESLIDIKSVWNQIQPQYQKAVSELQAWDKVAKIALESDREDLARAAIAKKLNYQKQATKLEIELGELAEMTENIVRNQKDFR